MTRMTQVELEVESLNRRLRLVEDELEQAQSRLQTSQDELLEANKLADETDRFVHGITSHVIDVMCLNCCRC